MAPHPNHPNRPRLPPPSYALIFLNRLRKHNEAQPKFVALKQPPEASEKPSVSFSQTSAKSVINVPTATVTATVSTTLPTLGTSSTIKMSSAPSYGSQNTASRTNSASDRAAPGTMSTNPASGHLASFSTLVQAKQMSTSPAKRPAASPIPTAPRLLPLRLSLPIKGYGKYSITKESAAGSGGFSQTPAAGVGTNSTGAQQQQRVGENQKLPITSRPQSLAKTIAEHTPNAFKTLGPGFNAKAATEKSLNTLSNSMMPSDYEHIFHAPSQASESHSAKHSSKKRHKKPKKLHKTASG